MKLIGLIGVAILLIANSQYTFAAGSWCNQPKNEPFWGAATSRCCQGWMGDDRRCHDVPDCAAFYRCCIEEYNSANKVTDTCT